MYIKRILNVSHKEYRMRHVLTVHLTPRVQVVSYFSDYGHGLRWAVRVDNRYPQHLDFSGRADAEIMAREIVHDAHVPTIAEWTARLANAPQHVLEYWTLSNTPRT